MTNIQDIDKALSYKGENADGTLVLSVSDIGVDFYSYEPPKFLNEKDNKSLRKYLDRMRIERTEDVDVLFIQKRLVYKTDENGIPLEDKYGKRILERTDNFYVPARDLDKYLPDRILIRSKNPERNSLYASASTEKSLYPNLTNRSIKANDSRYLYESVNFKSGCRTKTNDEIWDGIPTMEVIVLLGDVANEIHAKEKDIISNRENKPYIKVVDSDISR